MAAKTKHAAPRFTVQTPEPEFKGVRAGVRFDNGEGWTDSPATAAELALLGYRVTDHHANAAAARGDKDS